MAHFCGFIKLIFLLLMLARIPSNETRPLKGNSQANSDLIAGNEFLKLFMDHEQVDKDFYSSEYVGGGGSGSDNIRESRNIQKDSTESKSRKDVVEVPQKEKNYDKKSAETGRRSSSGRSLKDKGPKLNQAEGQLEDSKQVVKLVTSGSKIVFLEDYDENDAILDAEARDIDLKKEIFKQKSQTNLDDYKVVAVSVSSSSQRGTTTVKNRLVDTTTTTSSKYERKPLTTQKSTTPATTKSLTTNKVYVTMTPKTPTVTTTNISKISELSTMEASPTKIDTTAGDNFINRSHKSEFSIEEVEPLTMTQHKSRKLHSRHRSYPVTSVSDTLDVLDSENSASTNIHNILAAPLQPSASARSTSMVTTTYENGQRNMTINHDSNLHVEKSRHKSATATNVNDDKSADHEKQHIVTGSGGGVEDQLLPFQTVIYHDTKAGHGPQSRSISYSSISQNIEDLKKWQQSGIIAEARRNVSESLKPMPRSNTSSTIHQSEPAKFYSQPSKMYGEPSKFYSEPAKVYSEPAKVYGEAEKFYSEPAKVYGQPSKFYSEPAKVYSQPAKVYSEPAKTYWPVQTATTSTSTHSPSTIIPPTIAPTITTTVPIRHTIHQSSRKPAIVSRIAFGEAHLTSSTTTTTTSTTTTPAPSTSTPTRTFGQHHYSRTYSSHRNPSSSILVSNENSSSSSSSQSSSSTPSRRILFNLDRLPYDLLNAPEPSIQQQQLLELQKTKRPQQTPSSTYQESKQQQQQLQSKQKQRHNINPCLESAVSTLFSSSSLSAHPAVLKQRQQNPSLSDQQQQQHSNQNAKGLPNGDLVRCVAEISHTSAVGNDDSDDTGAGVDTFTTERSHIEELFTPTPEQNYEIEEAVSVMTNGRAHGSGVGGRNSLALPTTSPIHQQQHHGFKPNRQRTRVHFGTNVNNPTEVDDGGHQQQHHHYNNNANVNGETNNNNNRHHTAPDYSQYDDGSHDEGDDGGDGDGATNNNDYNDDGSSPANANAEEGNADDEDSKVAYIVEGHNYRKYRVEEETDDGFIVGEYGVVDHNDGNLRGVRYTADSTINRSLIQKALLTFLKLK